LVRKSYDLRAHAKDVANDTADARRGTFEGHYLRWMVVGLVRDHEPVPAAVVFAQMQDAGIFTGAAQDRGTLHRQRA